MNNFKIITREETKVIEAHIENIYICGYTSSDQKSLQDHINELQRIGVAPPEKTPMLFKKANLSAVINNDIRVISDDTSGEVEFFLFLQNENIFLGVASDHTDRGIEKIDVEKSKQICPVILSDLVWDYKKIKDLS